MDVVKDNEINQLEPKHVAFLLELMNTKGLAFPIDKARIAVETLDLLQAMAGSQK